METSRPDGDHRLPGGDAMSKSRYSKTKAAGQLVGMSRYGKQFGQQARIIPAENRQMRRMKKRSEVLP